MSQTHESILSTLPDTLPNPKEAIVKIIHDATLQLLNELAQHPETSSFSLPFTWAEQQWSLHGTLSREPQLLTFRHAVTSEDPQFTEERHVPGTRMKFAPGEVVYGNLVFPLASEQCMVTGMRASRTESPKYFSYALFLQQHEVIRALIASQPELQSISQITGLIIDGSMEREQISELTNWSSNLAQKLGYSEDPRIEGRYTYSYKG